MTTCLGCGRICERGKNHEGARCPKCKAEWNAKKNAARRARRGTTGQRGYDGAYEKTRLRVLAEEPYCYSCGAPATTVDHIIPLTLGGTNERANLHGCCLRCNSARGGQTGAAIVELHRSRR
jgi:5-methylcytosine-specific restriction protein A